MYSKIRSTQVNAIGTFLSDYIIRIKINKVKVQVTNEVNTVYSFSLSFGFLVERSTVISTYRTLVHVATANPLYSILHTSDTMAACVTTKALNGARTKLTTPYTHI